MKAHTVSEALDALRDAFKVGSIEIGGCTILLNGVRTGEPWYDAAGKMTSCPVTIEAVAVEVRVDPREVPVVNVTVEPSAFNASQRHYAEAWAVGAGRGAELLHGLLAEGLEPDEALATLRAELAALPPAEGPAWANKRLRGLDGHDCGAETARRNESIARVAAAAKRENDQALDDAVQSLLRAGVKPDELEIVSEPHKGPGAWRVRLRRKVCDCGRAV